MDERSGRLAQNEAIFRAGNERIDAILGRRVGVAAVPVRVR